MDSRSAGVVVVGGGPAGYVAAITAAQKQQKVTLIEEGHLGGTCLNKGCIPTKVLARAAAIYEDYKMLDQFGFEKGELVINWPRIQGRKEKIVATLRQGVGGLMRANKIEVLRGKAGFLSASALSVTSGEGENTVLQFSRAIIASGSSPAQIPGFPVDEESVFSSTGILRLNNLPKSLVVIGGGVIGLEFASIYSLLGAKVTVLEMLPQVLAGVDEEAARVAAGEMQKKGVQIWTGAKVEKIDRISADQVRVGFLQGESVREVIAEKVLMAAGRTPNTRGLGLEKAGVSLERGAIKVNSRMETSVPGIFAAGDVIGGYMLAHVAFAEGAAAALNAAGIEKRVSYQSVPACIYTYPEVAQVGLSEVQARQKYRDLKVGKFPLQANGKALINGETSGFVKIVTEPGYGEILGVSIVGHHATELIAEAGLAISAELTVEQLVETIHAHPTVSEAMREAGLVALGTPLHS